MTRNYEKDGCKIRICEKAYDTYSIKSCDERFSVGSMASQFATDNFEDAKKWIKENAKKFKNLYVEGYFIK